MTERIQISDTARAANAHRLWFPLSTPPTDPDPYVEYLVLVRWFEVAEVFEAAAAWHVAQPGCGPAYFEFDLWDDQHDQICQGDPGKTDILGWRYREVQP